VYLTNEARNQLTLAATPAQVELRAQGIVGAAAEKRADAVLAAEAAAVSGEEVEPVEALAPLCFPALTSLRLMCCTLTLLGGADSSELTALCIQVPNVRRLWLQVHEPLDRDFAGNALDSNVSRRMHDDALGWCRSAALHSLTHLHTLEIERPYWSLSKLTPRMIVDLSALAALGRSLVSVKMLAVCRLSGVDVSHMMTLRDPREAELTIDQCDSD
jgi:hypothetical protein